MRHSIQVILENQKQKSVNLKESVQTGTKTRVYMTVNLDNLYPTSKLNQF